MKRPFSDPFEALDLELSKYNLGGNVSVIFVDVHAEATSEKNALAQHFDGRVSIIAGTHTHIPTADLRILPMGTAYQTDIGMCGDYNSVIGMNKENSLKKFMKDSTAKQHFPALGKASISGLMVVADQKTGLAKKVQPIIMGGSLQERK